MVYTIGFGCYKGIIAVPSQVCDEYINEASKDDFKVLLYVFRHTGDRIESQKACAELKLSEEQLFASLRFWQSRGVFSFTCEKAETPQPGAVSASPKPEQEAHVLAAAHKVLDVPEQYSQQDIARKSQSNPEIKFLLESVPNQLGRLISPAECSTLIYLYEGAGLPADVIMMLVGYCVSCGKGNMRYIEKMAISWAEEGIDTYEKAESKIRELEERRSFEGKVRSMMGITGRALTPTERKYIAKWCLWKMPIELVKLAYDIGVSRTGKLSFPYINTILNSWHEKGYTTVEQARNENKKGKSTPKDNSPSFDIDEYVSLSMKKLHNE